MKFPGDARAFFFLGGHQASGQRVQESLGVCAVSNVDTRANISKEGAVGFKPRHANIKQPAVLSIETPQTVFHFEVKASVKGRRVESRTVVTVVRMHPRKPRVAQLLFHGAAREIQPALIEESTKVARSMHPDQRRGTTRQQPKALFAFAEYQFVLFMLFHQ